MNYFTKDLFFSYILKGFLTRVETLCVGESLCID